jgi:hypothetical protein
MRAVLVVGNRIDPASIANPHIRAHAFEASYFAQSSRRPCAPDPHGRSHRERYLCQSYCATEKIEQGPQPYDAKFGRSTEGAWRAEQKLAALAAWLALC